MANMQQLTKFDWARPSPLQGVGARRGEMGCMDISSFCVFSSEKQWGRGDNGGSADIFSLCVFFKQKKIKGGSTLNLRIL